MLVHIGDGILADIEHDAATGIIPSIERWMRVGLCPPFCTMSIVITRPVDKGCECVAEDEGLCSREAFDCAFNGVVRGFNSPLPGGPTRERRRGSSGRAARTGAGEKGAKP